MIFTLFATIDSVTLLGAMSGLLGCAIVLLKNIADLEHDLINTSDFMKNISLASKAVHLPLQLINHVQAVCRSSGRLGGKCPEG